MASFTEEYAREDEEYDYVSQGQAYVLQHQDPVTALVTQGITTKVPPMFDGRTSWFSYEEQVDDWIDLTTLDPEKHGPALKNRLTGDAAVYKPLLDRDLLKDANTGAQYFKDVLRPHFVKGSQSVFLWRFFQSLRCNRGHQDLLKWIGKLTVIRKRVLDSWMDYTTERCTVRRGGWRSKCPETGTKLAATGSQR